ncbi:MAG: aminopeptidase [Williamsia sp.]|nr:aminopeptidase [Williamsia sp.]
MKKILFLSGWLCCGVLYGQQTGSPPVERGISQALAVYRQHQVSDIQYTLQFNIPALKSSPVTATETVEFTLQRAGQPLQLDFKQPAGNLKKLSVNGHPASINLQQEHLLISSKDLHAGKNKLDIDFTAGDASLNRNDDYLYALFVPDHAHAVFPCFDQPDLKARFKLSLQVPAGWAVLANGAKTDSVVTGEQTLYHFASSDKISTYLFSFAAGKYSEAVQQAGAYHMEFLYRETDTAKIRLSIDSVFAIHRDAIRFLEEYTGILFPFQKVGFAAIPDFQFGGMEHPGEVQYKASSLFLDEGATRDAQIARISLISHETAHMWFGDLVTMRWFNDVWMKEVFANFMADKVTENLLGTETFNAKFLQDHYPAAYSIDRTSGSHAVRQALDNLQEAGSLYGNIIYHKAPIMMRQLEALMGKDSFRLGLKEYLKTYAYGNATWPDLISILNKHSKIDLYNWNKVWVNEPGRPVFDYTIAYNSGQVSRFAISQHPESGKPRVWPQGFEVAFVYPDHLKTIQVNMDKATVELPAAKGLDKPQFIHFNSNGTGYGLFPADKNGLSSLFKLKSPLQRASAYITLYENMLAGRVIKPADLLQLLAEGLTTEQNEMNLRLLTGYLTNIYWTFLSPAKREALAQETEEQLWTAMQGQSAANNKKILFKAYQDVFTSDSAQRIIYAIWQQQQPPQGVKLTEDDYTSLALSIALKTDTATRVLQQQEARIKNEDRKKRLQYLEPALSADPAVRDQFFARLKDRRNREKEAWVVTALSYLHHPLRQATSIRHLPESLALLEEIQRTGDIFFPQSWLSAAWGMYQNKEAARIATDFLKTHPAYPPKLRNKLLQATDNLLRAQKLVE